MGAVQDIQRALYNGVVSSDLLDKDDVGRYVNWSPNNIKRILIGWEGVAVVWYVGSDTLTFESWKRPQDVFNEFTKGSTGILAKALKGFVYSNLLEVAFINFRLYGREIIDREVEEIKSLGHTPNLVNILDLDTNDSMGSIVNQASNALYITNGSMIDNNHLGMKWQARMNRINGSDIAFKLRPANYVLDTKEGQLGQLLANQTASKENNINKLIELVVRQKSIINQGKWGTLPNIHLEYVYKQGSQQYDLNNMGLTPAEATVLEKLGLGGGQATDTNTLSFDLILVLIGNLKHNYFKLDQNSEEFKKHHFNMTGLASGTIRPLESNKHFKMMEEAVLFKI